MSAPPFGYPDEQWRALEEIVGRAGGDEAREKFAAGQVRFEKMVGGYKRRIPIWNGKSCGDGNKNREKFERIAAAARELGLALDHHGSYIGLAKDVDQLLRLREVLSSVATNAGMMAAKSRKSKNLMRNRLFSSLASYWRNDLGLDLATADGSHLVQFIETATTGVWNAPTKESQSDDWLRRDIISKVLKRNSALL